MAEKVNVPTLLGVLGTFTFSAMIVLFNQSVG